MESIREYKMIDNWKNSTNSRFCIVSLNDTKYFLKCFYTPVIPSSEKCSEKIYLQEIQKCDSFVKRQKRLLSKMSSVASVGGNIMIPVDFFEYDNRYYKVTPYIEEEPLTLDEIVDLDITIKLKLLKSITHSLKSLNRAGVVHGDIKPDNIVIHRTMNGDFKAKIIDFDDSFVEYEAPISEELKGDANYYSPELAEYIIDENEINKERITCLSDVYSLGVLFHLYLTGEFPPFNPEYKYPFESSIDSGTLEISSNIQTELAEIIESMLITDIDLRDNINEVFDNLKGVRLGAGSDIPRRKRDKKIQYSEKLMNNKVKVYYMDGSYSIFPSHVLEYIE